MSVARSPLLPFAGRVRRDAARGSAQHQGEVNRPGGPSDPMLSQQLVRAAAPASPGSGRCTFVGPQSQQPDGGDVAARSSPPLKRLRVRDRERQRRPRFGNWSQTERAVSDGD